MESPQEDGGEGWFYWALGDLKFSPAPGELSQMVGLKFFTLFLGGWVGRQPSEFTMAFSFAVVKPVKVVIYNSKILSSSNFRLLLLNFLNRKQKYKQNLPLKFTIYLVSMTFFSYPEQWKVTKYHCAMKQFFLSMIWQIHLISQVTFKKINWLFFLSPTDTGVKKLNSFHSFIWKKKKMHICF